MCVSHFTSPSCSTRPCIRIWNVISKCSFIILLTYCRYCFITCYSYITYTIFCIVYLQVKCRHSIISRFISNFWIIVCFIFSCFIFSCYCIFITCSISFNFKWSYLKLITIINNIHIFIIIYFFQKNIFITFCIFCIICYSIISSISI